MTAPPALRRRSSLRRASRSRYSSARKSRPAIRRRPSVRSVASSALYCAALSVGHSWSGVRFRPTFQAASPNGIWLTTVALRTPGSARNAARSSRVRAVASTCRPMPPRAIVTSSASATPLALRRVAMRLPIRNSALQTIAQASAISSTISVAAVRCRDSVESIGPSAMAATFNGRAAPAPPGRSGTAAATQARGAGDRRTAVGDGCGAWRAR
ncbi:hypothetical protein NB706_003669 [Xanthomonas sacchari]|nr:hypothetical protein [Xanthomonas sacchari]